MSEWYADKAEAKRSIGAYKTDMQVQVEPDPMLQDEVGEGELTVKEIASLSRSGYSRCVSCRGAYRDDDTHTPPPRCSGGHRACTPAHLAGLTPAPKRMVGPVRYRLGGAAPSRDSCVLLGLGWGRRSGGGEAEEGVTGAYLGRNHGQR
jgi:hypothetical protein